MIVRLHESFDIERNQQHFRPDLLELPAGRGRPWRLFLVCGERSDTVRTCNVTPNLSQTPFRISEIWLSWVLVDPGCEHLPIEEFSCATLFSHEKHHS